MILLSHPTGNANVRRAASAFQVAGILKEFWTTFEWRENVLFEDLLPARVARELRKRSFPDLPKESMRTWPYWELGRQICKRLGCLDFACREDSFFSVDAVYRSLDRRVARRLMEASGVSAVYTYEDCARLSFNAAKKMGKATLYEHPVAYWRTVQRIQRAEAEENPDAVSTLPSLAGCLRKGERKDEELKLADRIIVPSTFAMRSISEWEPSLSARIEVVPYGSPPLSTAIRRRVGRLRVLFVGALTHAKGLAYLLRAAASLKNYLKLTLIGERVHESFPSGELSDGVEWLGQLPRDEVLQAMEQHDVLCMPSLHEGFGLVLLEALSRSLPVIATVNTGAPDIIRDGIEGFIVPIQSSEAIQERLRILIEDRDRLEAMSASARDCALRNCWSKYDVRLLDVVAPFSNV